MHCKHKVMAKGNHITKKIRNFVPPKQKAPTMMQYPHFLIPNS